MCKMCDLIIDETICTDFNAEIAACPFCGKIFVFCNSVFQEIKFPTLQKCPTCNRPGLRLTGYNVMQCLFCGSGYYVTKNGLEIVDNIGIFDPPLNTAECYSPGYA